jgi:LysM repeat protein
MTAADAGAPLAEPSPSPTVPAPEASAGPAHPEVLSGCRYLLAEAGAWRLDSPSRDHRCAAFSPPAPLAPEKQARLCLTASHVTCATYLASLAAREDRLGSTTEERATRWGLARTTTVIEDPGGIRSRVLATVRDRRRWPAITGLRGFLPATGVAATPTLPPATNVPSIAATVPPLTEPPTGTAAPTSTPASTPAPTALPTATAAPTATPKPTFQTYVVKHGDTLSAIAAKYHTTVSAIAALNHLSDPGALSVGQVLLIPN